MKVNKLSTPMVYWAQGLLLAFIVSVLVIALYTAFLGHWGFSVFMVLVGGVIIIVEKKNHPYVFIREEYLIVKNLIFIKTTFKLAEISCLHEKHNSFELSMKNGKSIPIYDSVFSTGFLKINFENRKKELLSKLPEGTPCCP